MDLPDELSTAPPCGQLAREVERINRTLRTLGAGTRTLLRASNEQELLEQMCRVLVDSGGHRMALVAYAVHDEAKSIDWKVAVGVEVAHLAAYHFSWADTELGGTAAGTAIRTGKPVVGRRLLTDPAYAGPAYAELREQAILNRYASVTAFPLCVEGQVLGSLVLGSGDPDAFDEEEVKLLGSLADDLAYGIANLRARVQIREAQATITRLAFYDTLTGLPNRTLLRERLEAAMQTARQGHHALALLHLEVGRLQEINRLLGYRAGDELLRLLARRLQQEVQEDETLARVGEGAFALLLPSAGAEQAVQLAQKLVAGLREPFDVAGLALDAQVGIGIALFPGHATEADLLIRRASRAMHQAKPVRGGYALYAGGREEGCTRRLELMGDFQRAVKNQELRLYCQPKIDLGTGRVCGAEALVRWQHPRHGIISPAEFIHMAEQAGTITPLTNWMLEAVFSQSYAWHETGAARALALNLSAHDLYDPGLIDRIRGLFLTWGVAPSLIQFELTESAMMSDPVSALETLTRLKRLDVELFVDDYGTGYSSLGYLQKLPVDAVKIDQSFVTPMMSSADSQVIVGSTIELGHNLGLKVVAEGVDSQAIWDRLAALGCDVAQGFAIAMPMPAEQFEAWEANWQHAAGEAHHQQMNMPFSP
jgi:diguanylate cyclase (GGDEF)-like protein